MIKKEEKKQLIKIAKMYYFEELTQAKIAKKLGVSRPVISKMLQRARDEGIVEIRIHDDGFDVTELEQAIAQYFQLDDVVVTPTENMPEDLMQTALGRTAATYLSSTIRDTKTIGVSWGKSLYAMVQAYPVEQREGIKIIPLVGGIGTKAVELHANQIAYEWAKKLNGESESLYAPAVAETLSLREDLLRSPHISSVLEQGKRVDLAIVGIGNPFRNSTIEEIGYLEKSDIQKLKEAQVVGDIGSKYILKDGSEANHVLNQKAIGINLNDLKHVKRVIGIAAGVHKVESILAALKGGYLHVLITDDRTASAIVNQIKNNA